MKAIKATKISNTPTVDRQMLPSFSLTTKDLPEIKDWKVGGVYYLRIKVEQISLGKGDSEWSNPKSNDKTMNARFQMIGIEAEKDKEHYEDEYARKRSKY